VTALSRDSLDKLELYNFQAGQVSRDVTEMLSGDRYRCNWDDRSKRMVDMLNAKMFFTKSCNVRIAQECSWRN